MLIGLIFMFAIAVLEIVFRHIERKAWMKETGKLLDRIQSRSLMEFKTVEAREEEEKKPPKPPEPDRA